MRGMLCMIRVMRVMRVRGVGEFGGVAMEGVIWGVHGGVDFHVDKFIEI